MKEGKDYFESKNTTITNLEKKMYITRNNVPIAVNNPYASNFKIYDGSYKDIVEQPVLTLLDEPPIIESEDEQNLEKVKKFIGKDLGYYLKELAINSISQGVGYLYTEYTTQGFNYYIFDSENIIPFIELNNGNIVSLLRYSDIYTLDNKILYTIEIYELDGISIYNSNDNYTFQFIKQIPYKTKIIQYEIETQQETLSIEQLPFLILKNNKYNQSDLTNNVKSKIDAIDIVNSDFANNLNDLQEAFLHIKNYQATTTEELQQFIQQVKSTKVIKTDDDGQVDLITQDIPYEARRVFVEMISDKLYAETGTLDYSKISGQTLTNLALKLASKKLMNRVNKLEFEIYKLMRNLIQRVIIELNISEFDYDIDFVISIVQNSDELVDTANKLQPNISQRSYLTLIQRAGFIENVDNELENLHSEYVEPVTLSDEEV